MTEYIEREALPGANTNDNDYADGWNECLEAINAIPAADVRPVEWIPVTERLPDMNVPCLVYNKYYGPMVGWRVDSERFRIPGSRFPDHPTHWMPLPQPPKEE